MRLVPQRSNRSEIMDRADNATSDLRAALGDLCRTNRWLGGRRALFSALRPFLLSGSGPLEILDVGTGGADLPLEMFRFGLRIGRELRVTAIDREPRTAGIAASEAAGCPRVRVLCADAWRLPFADRSFDLVTASLFLHHFEHEEIVRLLDKFRRLSRRAVLVNDLHRHLVPWAFIYCVSRLTLRHPMYVHDAPLSVLRGFTPSELSRAARETGASPIRLQRRWPFRLALTVPALEDP
jgi:SAM-dependent methyltransferase